MIFPPPFSTAPPETLTMLERAKPQTVDCEANFRGRALAHVFRNHLNPFFSLGRSTVHSASLLELETLTIAPFSTF